MRPAVPADAPALAALYVRAWRAAYPGLVPQDYLDALVPGDRLGLFQATLAAVAWPRRGVLVLDATGPGAPGTPLGFVSLGPSRDEDADPALVGEIETLYLDPAAFGTGAGDLLMAGALRCLEEGGYRSATLWVLGTNTRARRFYARHGWHPDGALVRHDWGAFVATDVRYARALGPAVTKGPGPGAARGAR